MLIVLDQNYFLALLHLGVKEGLWDKSDFHPWIASRIHHNDSLERALLLNTLLFDDLLFFLPFEFGFDRPGSLTADRTIPRDLIESKTGWRWEISSKSLGTGVSLGYLHELIYGWNPDPIKDFENIKISLDLLTSLPYAAVSIVGTLGGGPLPYRIPSVFVNDLIRAILDQDRNEFELISIRYKKILKEVRKAQQLRRVKVVKALEESWKHTALSDIGRSQLKSNTPVMYDDPFFSINPNELACSNSALDLLVYASLLLAASYRFKDLLHIDDYIRDIEPSYRLAISMKIPPKIQVPKSASLVFYAIAFDRFAQEGLSLPWPETLSEARKLRSHPSILAFRQNVWRWCDAAAAGEKILLNNLTNDLIRATKSLNRMKQSKKVGKFLTYAGLPISIGEMLYSLPYVGPITTAVGFVLQVGTETDKIRNRWIQLIK